MVGSWEQELPLGLQGIWRKSRKWMAAAVGATHRGTGPSQSSGTQHQVLGTSLTVQDSPVSLPSPLPFPPTSSLQSRAGREGYGVGIAGAKTVVESMVKT